MVFLAQTPPFAFMKTFLVVKPTIYGQTFQLRVKTLLVCVRLIFMGLAAQTNRDEGPQQIQQSFFQYLERDAFYATIDTD